MKRQIGFMLLVFIGIFISTISAAQRTGPQAEMERLERQAEDLASQNDSEGASLAIGKAAMMADILLKKTKEPNMKMIYQAASSLYRGQELGLKALAIYEQTGNIPPAPAGVCNLLLQGTKKLKTSREWLHQIPLGSLKNITKLREDYLRKNEDWDSLFKEFYTELECK